MIIETFRPGCFEAVYDRFASHGRMLPDGVLYLDSWLTADKSRCFQLMQSESAELLSTWIESWQDLVEFEVIELGDKPE